MSGRLAQFLLAAALSGAAPAPGETPPSSFTPQEEVALRAAVERLLPGATVSRLEAAPAGAATATPLDLDLALDLDLDLLRRAEVDLEPHAREGRVERFRRLRCERRRAASSWRCSARSVRDWVHVAALEREAAPCAEGTRFELPIFLSAAEIVDLLDFVQSAGLGALLPEHEPALEVGEACSIAWIEPWPGEKYDIYTKLGASLSTGRLFEVRRVCGEPGAACELSLVRAISWGR